MTSISNRKFSKNIYREKFGV